MTTFSFDEALKPSTYPGATPQLSDEMDSLQKAGQTFDIKVDDSGNKIEPKKTFSFEDAVAPKEKPPGSYDIGGDVGSGSFDSEMGIVRDQAAEPKVERARIPGSVMDGSPIPPAKPEDRAPYSPEFLKQREQDLYNKNAANLQGTMSKSTFDFDTADEYDQKNMLTRGARRMSLGSAQFVAGMGQFISDAYGADEAAKFFKDQNEAFNTKSTAIESGLAKRPYWQQQMEGAISSSLQNVPTLAAGILSGAEAPALLYMGLQSFGQEYSNGDQANLSFAERSARAAIYGAFEIIGEKIGMPSFMDSVKAITRGMPARDMIKSVLAHGAKEVVGEEFTTTGEFLTDKLAPFGLTPNATAKDYVQAVADTLVQTVMQTGMMAGGGAAINAGVRAQQNTPEAKADLTREWALNKWETEGFHQPPPAAPPANPVDRLRNKPSPAEIADPIVNAPTLDAALETAMATTRTPITITDQGEVYNADAPIVPMADQLAAVEARAAPQGEPNEHQAALNDAIGTVGPDGIALHAGTPVRAVEIDSLPDAADSAAAQGRTTRQGAQAIRDLVGKAGTEVTFFADDPKLPDGFVDPNNPNRIFVSDNPQRGMVFTANHEFKHTTENITLPDGSTLNDQLVEAVHRGMTPEGRAYAFERFRSSLPAGATQQQTEEHFANELSADIGGWALLRKDFLSKMFTEIETRHGEGVVKSVMAKFLNGITDTIRTIKLLFKGQPSQQDLSTKVVSNLEEVHGILAKMYADKFGGVAAENLKLESERVASQTTKTTESTGPPKSAWTAEQDRVLNEKLRVANEAAKTASSETELAAAEKLANEAEDMRMEKMASMGQETELDVAAHEAAIWTAIKARVEGSEAERNAWEDKHGVRIAKTDEKGRVTHEIAPGREYDHYRAATRFGLKSPITQEQIDASNFDFGHALRDRSATISWEATPGVTSGVLPGIHNAPMSQQEEYLTEVRGALADGNGEDIIDKKLGLLTTSGDQLYSGWQGKTTVGVQQNAGVVIDDGLVSGISRTLVNLAADIRGYVLSQEGVAWHFPVYNGGKFGQNGVEYKLGRPLTENETQALYNTLKTELGNDFSPPIPTGDGFRVLNFPDEKFALLEETDRGKIKDLQKSLREKNKFFQEAVDKAVVAQDFFSEVHDAVNFETDGELRANDWSRGAAEYRARISEAAAQLQTSGWADGRNLLDWVDDVVRPKVNAVNQKFSERYGWGKFQFSPKSDVARDQRDRSGTGALVQGEKSGAVGGTGIHYSTAPRNTLASDYYGTGYKGAELQRVREADDARLQHRIYFYVNGGNGINPESGVGPHAHQAELTNLYDAQADARDLWVGRTPNEFESAVLNAGFDGYVTPRVGTAVLLGPRSISVDYLGMGERPDVSRVGEAQQSAYRQQLREVQSNRTLPAGEMTGAEWKLLQDRVGIDLSHLDDTQRYYKNQIVPRPALQMSPKDEPVVGIAPNGKKSKLTDEQWAVVRTPAFKRWFGDWEKVHNGKDGSGVWSADDVSKVVDENGEPRVVYHGSKAAGFTTFDPSEANPGQPYTMYFSSQRDVARTYSGTRNETDLQSFDDETGEYDQHRGVYSVFLNIRNPYETSFEGANWDGQRNDQWQVVDDQGELIYAPDGKAYFDSLDEAEALAGDKYIVEKAQDHHETTHSIGRNEAGKYKQDGAIIHDVVDDGGEFQTYDTSTVYITVDPAQIKSAVANNGEFSLYKNDIRYSPKQTETPEFKKWFGDSKVVDSDGNPEVVYHSTDRAFNKFSFKNATQKIIWFTNDRAASDAGEVGAAGRGKVMELYASIKNPASWEQYEKLGLNELQSRGYDGAILRDSDEKYSGFVFEGSQLKSATKNNGQFDATNSDIRYSPKPFYSALTRAVEESKTNSAPADQWVATLNKTAGVKADEIKWSGVDDWLMQKGGKVTRQEVLDYLRANEVNVQEVVLGDTGKWNSELSQRLDELERRDRIGDLTDAESTERQELISLENEHSESGGAPAITKFSNWQLPGGENYRELLLTLPESPDKRARLQRQMDELRNGRLPENMSGDEQTKFYELLADYEGTSRKSAPFMSSHFDQPNILAHVRFNERTDADGKRVLFIEEVQSDWAQKGRRSGFNQPSKENFIAWAEDKGLVDEDSADRFVEQNFNKSGNSYWAQYKNETGASSEAPPSAPFIGNTSSWSMLAMKRMIRYAAEHGFDKIAWTTGEQQAARYDLSKHISSLTAERLSDGSYGIRAIDPNMRPMIDQKFTEKELPDAIGKDLAEKIVKQPERMGYYQSLDLKVGGEGMKGFYDKILPAEVNKYVKRWGVKVGEIQLTASREGRSDYSIKEGATGFTARVGDEAARWSTWEEANAWINERMGLVQPSITITPAMRESAMQGQPLFSPKNLTNPNAAIPEETAAQEAQRIGQDKFNRFKIVHKWLGDNGLTLSEAANVYRAEALYYGRVASRVQDFRDVRVKALIKDLEKTGHTLAEVDMALHAQHAEERNKQIAKINPQMKDGGSGMKTADARAILAKLDPELLRVANDFRAITTDTKNILLASGLIDQLMANAWDAAYKKYVPLKGGDEVVATGTGKHMDVNAKMKRAMGHSFREEHIVENIIRDHERAITLAEKNRVAQVLLQFALEADIPDLITIGQPEKRATLVSPQPVYEVRYQGGTIATLHSLQDARAEMQYHIQTTGMPAKNFAVHKVQGGPSVRYMASPMIQENEARVYLNGQMVRMQINDPLMARAYKNLGQDHLVGVLKVGREINTWLSKAYTGYNPAFLLKNIIRDAGEGVINLTGEYGAGTAARVVANYPSQFLDLLVYAKSGRASQMIRDYRADGGSTGAAYLGDLERIGEDARAAYNDYAGVLDTARRDGVTSALGVAGDKTVSALAHYIEVLNQAGENAMRLSTYKTLREAGYSRSEAALAAKDVTINFNRKGEIGQQAGALWLFFNPAVQGSARTLHTLLHSEHKTQAWALTGAMALLFYAMAAWNNDVDKKRWEETPDYDKAHNLIIPMGKYQVKIPISYGYGFFGALGTAAFDLQNGKPMKNVVWQLANAFAESFSPIGNPVGDKPDMRNAADIVPFTPLKVATQIGVNRSGLGGPIYPENQRAGKPDSATMFRNTKGSIWDWAASAANRATGGNEAQAGWVDVHPDTIKSLWATATGGTGRFITDSAQLANVVARGATPELHEIPIARDFLREPRIGDTRKAFWNAANEVEVAQGEFATAKANMQQANRGTSAEARADAAKIKDQVLADTQAMRALGSTLSQFKRAVDAKRDAIDAIQADKSLTLNEQRLKVREMEVEEKALYDRFLAIFRIQQARQKKP